MSHVVRGRARERSARCGEGGWGNAAIAAGAAIGAVYFVRITVRAALAYSIAGSGDTGVTSALNDFSWAVIVIGWFPVAS